MFVVSISPDADTSAGKVEGKGRRSMGDGGHSKAAAARSPSFEKSIE
jgi:nanoRNase/pAp phosphatase (c-di-AMP/oligoRNAs hydrolase)